MAARYYTLAAFSIITLAGCQTEPPAPVVDLAPLSTQIGALSVANADLAAANARLRAANEALVAENARMLAMLRSDVDMGIVANNQGRTRMVGFTLQHQFSLLRNTPSDAQTTNWWAQVDDAEKAGNETALQGVINKLTDDANKTHGALGTLHEQVDNLTRDRDAANEAATVALEKVQQAEQAIAAAVAKAKADKDAEFAAKVKAWQANAANWAGAGLGALALVFAAGAFLLSPASKKLGEAAVVSVLLCIGCFAFARFLGWQWFFPFVGGTYAVIGAGWAAWKVRAGMREEAEKKEAVANAAFVPYAVMLVDIINEADKNATVAERPTLEKLLFDPLKAADKTGQFDVLRHELETQKALVLVK